MHESLKTIRGISISKRMSSEKGVIPIRKTKKRKILDKDELLAFFFYFEVFPLSLTQAFRFADESVDTTFLLPLLHSLLFAVNIELLPSQIYRAIGLSSFQTFFTVFSGYSTIT